jgi:hypothetical protein
MVINNNSANLEEKFVKEEKWNFTCSPFPCAIYEQNINFAETGKLNIRTFQVDQNKNVINWVLCFFQGTVKQVIQFVDREGDPFLINVNGSFYLLIQHKEIELKLKL